MFRFLTLVGVVALASLPGIAGAQGQTVAVEHVCSSHSFAWWTPTLHLDVCTASQAGGLQCRSEYERNNVRRHHSVTYRAGQVEAFVTCPDGTEIFGVATNPGGVGAIGGNVVSTNWTSVTCGGSTISCGATPGSSVTSSSGTTSCTITVD